MTTPIATLAEEILTTFAGDAHASLGSHATLLLAATLLAEPVQIVVVGDEATPGFAAHVRRGSRQPPCPHASCSVCRPVGTLPATHPAAGKRLLDGRAAAYVCSAAPAKRRSTEPAALRERRLARPSGFS